MITCTVLNPRTADWNFMDSFQDRTVFQTREWIQFIAETQNAIPLLLQLTQRGKLAGYFTGLTFTRFGIRILGASFPGWTTPYMGFNLLPGVSRRDALQAVERFAWENMKCLHMEISDPHFKEDDGIPLGFTLSFFTSYRTDLTRSDQDLFQQMDSACRRCIRKAEKCGIAIEETSDPGFAKEYYRQLQDVFAKQGLAPTYAQDRVQALIRHMASTGRLLLLRARDPQGNCIASGIFPGYNRIAEFWGNASFRSSQIFRPNELMHWYVMRYWKRRGAEIYDWGGEGTYKEKYGCFPYRVPWFIKSRYPFISRLRDEAKKIFQRRQRFLGWIKGDHALPAHR